MMTAIPEELRARALDLGPVDCCLTPGLAPEINALAVQAPASHRFLREAWYCRAQPASVSTLVARRKNGSPILALPMRQFGPRGLRARTLAGSYWPFRSAPVAQDATVEDLAALLDHPIAQAAIGPVLRIGPIYDTDPLHALVTGAAATKGWQVLTRSMGQTFTQNIVSPDGQAAWPSSSRRKKIRRLTARLEQHGPVTMRIVRGAAWSRQVFRDLARIEENSWVGTRTDRSGAKFLNPLMLAHWQRSIVDPVIAEMLAATIIYVGDRPLAFSLDLTSGALQYGIASSYDQAFADCSPGQIVTVHAVDDSIARGVRQIDWGAGDSGYKRELGAEPGALIHDMLLVRNAPLAAALRPKWEESTGSGTMALAAGLADALSASGLPGGTTIKRILLTGLALSAAATALAD